MKNIKMSIFLIIGFAVSGCGEKNNDTESTIDTGDTSISDTGEETIDTTDSGDATDSGDTADTTDSGDTEIEEIEETNLSVQGITSSDVVINRFRSTKYGTPFSDWFPSGWQVSDIPAGSNGLEFELPCDVTDAWASLEAWANSGSERGGSLWSSMGGTELERLNFYDAVLTHIHDCNNSSRAAVIRTDSMEGVSAGSSMRIELQGQGDWLIEKIKVGASVIATEEDWNSTNWLSSGDLVFTGLCGTDEANAAYGWELVTFLFGNGSSTAGSIVMLSETGNEVGRVNLYDVIVSDMGTCSFSLQQGTLYAGQIESSN